MAESIVRDTLGTIGLNNEYKCSLISLNIIENHIFLSMKEWSKQSE